MTTESETLTQPTPAKKVWTTPAVIVSELSDTRVSNAGVHHDGSFNTGSITS